VNSNNAFGSSIWYIFFNSDTRQKHLGRRGPQAQIAKPIRAGQGAIAIRGGGAVGGGAPLAQASAVNS